MLTQLTKRAGQGVKTVDRPTEFNENLAWVEKKISECWKKRFALLLDSVFKSTFCFQSTSQNHQTRLVWFCGICPQVCVLPYRLQPRNKKVMCLEYYLVIIIINFRSHEEAEDVSFSKLTFTLDPLVWSGWQLAAQSLSLWFSAEKLDGLSRMGRRVFKSTSLLWNQLPLWNWEIDDLYSRFKIRLKTFPFDEAYSKDWMTGDTEHSLGTSQ